MSDVEKVPSKPVKEPEVVPEAVIEVVPEVTPQPAPVELTVTDLLAEERQKMVEAIANAESAKAEYTRLSAVISDGAEYILQQQADLARDVEALDSERRHIKAATLTFMKEVGI